LSLAKPGPDSPASSPEGSTLASHAAFAFGRDSSPLYYRVSGRADGPAIVLTDGIGCDGYIWKYLAPALEAEHFVIHWHYRGHGLTPPPRAPERVELSDFADDLIAVLDAALAPDRRGDGVILAGHSMGVQVSLEAFRQLGDRVRAFVMLCGSSGLPLRTFKGRDHLERLLPLVTGAIALAPDLVRRAWRGMMATEISYQIATRFELNGKLIRRADFFPYLEHMADRVDPQLFFRVLRSAAEHSAADVLERIHVPTLIIAGDRDGFTPAHLSETMASRIRGSELTMIEGGSHTAPIERPVEITERVMSFLRDRVQRT
jgi:pimeloyl-ACP methyl ester carboxylesterase